MQDSTPAVISVINALTLTLSCLFSVDHAGQVAIIIGNAAHFINFIITKGDTILLIRFAFGRRMPLQGNVILQLTHRWCKWGSKCYKNTWIYFGFIYVIFEKHLPDLINLVSIAHITHTYIYEV